MVVVLCEGGEETTISLENHRQTVYLTEIQQNPALSIALHIASYRFLQDICISP
jgi:hypothetical protein